MQDSVSRVLLIVNLHKENARLLMKEITDTLQSRGISVTICSFEGKPIAPPEGHYDLAFSLGGDGTVLYAARCLAERGIPILPIHLGTLGFIASVQRTEWLSVFEAYQSGKYTSSSRLMLDIRVERNGVLISKHSCLNDAVVAGTGISKIIRLTVRTESIRFGVYRADGLIVATPTGSTAYSVAAGGPIVDPEIDAIILNPVCPFTLSNRAIVFPAHETVIVDVEKEQRSDVLLTVDGQIVEPLLPGDVIKVHRTRRKAIIIASDRNVFYTVLRTKLNWSGGPDA
ncbi:MAG: NAD(+)/NADH kinase [Treponemataceae bacterium]